MREKLKTRIKRDFALVSTLIRREFAIRYKGSFLGILWVFGAPLLMITTYSIFMFGLVRAQTGTGTTITGLVGLWLCLGLWQWLSEGTIRSATTFHDNAAMVKKTPLKLSLLPFTNVIVSALGFVLPLAFSLGAMLLTHAPPISYLLLALGIIAILPWFFALAFFMSILGTFLREVRFALPLCFNLGLFLSPIFYSADHAPSLVRPFLLANPLGHHFDYLKAAVSGDIGAFSIGFAISTVAGVILLASSLALFTNRNGEFADVV